MSLIRQIWLLLLGTLLLAFAGSVAIIVTSARDTLQTQLRLKNSDNAGSLAMVLSQQKGDRELMSLLAGAQFDTGYYRRVRLTATDGTVLFQREADARPAHAPGWFVALLPIDLEQGTAQVSDGWRALGSVEVSSQTAFAHDELWSASQRSAGALAIVGLLAGLLGTLAVTRLRRPLDCTVKQAQMLERGEYLQVAEPRAPELRRVTRAMNSMVARLKLVFEAQAGQVETMRRQASQDSLTGLSNRTHLMAQLGALLSAEDGAAACGLVLLRVERLGDVNRALGHAATDRVLVAIAQTLQTYAQHVPGCMIGRVNGSDFALCLPVGGVAQETGQALSELLRAVLPSFGGQIVVAVGAAEARRGVSLGVLVAAADMALARAESGGGAVTVEIAVESPAASNAGGDDAAADGSAADVVPVHFGEASWREHIHDALAQGRVRLASFPVVNSVGTLLHLECPLRVQLDPNGAFEVAAHWLPLAVRSRLTAAADEAALALALEASARDGMPRCVNLSPASLLDSGFASRLRGRLMVEPQAAAKLSLEVNETAAFEQFDLVQELGRQLRPTGARLGLEHAGEQLGRIGRLFEASLDYVKLDAAVAHGVAGYPERAAFVSGMVAMLHGLAIQVMAEGVASEADAMALWACGVDGLTGPWISAQHAAAARRAG
ncbi:LapD/MoxY N-terminal periplasmic domain-containing protein [soil metagenome]